MEPQRASWRRRRARRRRGRSTRGSGRSSASRRLGRHRLGRQRSSASMVFGCHRLLYRTHWSFRAHGSPRIRLMGGGPWPRAANGGAGGRGAHHLACGRITRGKGVRVRPAARRARSDGRRSPGRAAPGLHLGRGPGPAGGRGPGLPGGRVPRQHPSRTRPPDGTLGRRHRRRRRRPAPVPARAHRQRPPPPGAGRAGGGHGRHARPGPAAHLPAPAGGPPAPGELVAWPTSASWSTCGTSRRPAPGSDGRPAWVEPAVLDPDTFDFSSYAEARRGTTRTSEPVYAGAYATADAEYDDDEYDDDERYAYAAYDEYDDEYDEEAAYVDELGLALPA